MPKVQSLRESVLRLNPNVVCTAHEERFTADNALRLLGQYDWVADCTDNPATRYLINDACVLAGKPLVSGAAIGFDGQVLPPPPSLPAPLQQTKDGPPPARPLLLRDPPPARRTGIRLPLPRRPLLPLRPPESPLGSRHGQLRGQRRPRPGAGPCPSPVRA